MNEQPIPLAPPVHYDALVKHAVEIVLYSKMPVPRSKLQRWALNKLRRRWTDPTSGTYMLAAEAAKVAMRLALQLAAERAQLAICTKSGCQLADSFSSIGAPGEAVSISIDKQSILDIEKLFV